MLGFGKAYASPYVLPDPSGGFDTELERVHLVFLYAGISPSGVVADTGGADGYLLRSRWRRR